MDPNFLKFYELELEHIRKMGKEFAAEFPKIAGRLAHNDDNLTFDPYVERLIESFAFLTARIHHKMDAEFPRFTQSLLNATYPQFQTPTPSMVIAQIYPDEAESDLAHGFSIERNTKLTSISGNEGETSCEFRTSHEVKLWPIKILNAEYFTQQSVGILNLPSSLEAKAALRIRLGCTADLTFDQLQLDTLVVYIKGIGETPMRIYEQLFTQCSTLVVQSQNSKKEKITSAIAEESTIKPLGFDPKEAMFPVDSRQFDGFRLLREYSSLPQRFMFVQFAGLSPTLKKCPVDEIDLIIPFRESDFELQFNSSKNKKIHVSKDNFALFCTPAINLFPKRINRAPVSNRFSEFHVVPERTRPLDFEVYQVGKVIGFGVHENNSREFLPMYSANDIDRENDNAEAFFTTHRVRRSEPKGGRRVRRNSTYLGSELYVSLVDSASAPYSTTLRQLGFEALCTNRDLPIFMSTPKNVSHFSLDVAAPVISIQCIQGPTIPRASPAENKTEWQAIRHLSLNLAALSESDEKTGVAMLRDLLTLYADTSDPQIRKQIGGVIALKSRPITKRVQLNEPISFARGLEFTIEFDESAFLGTGVFLLGSVIAEVLAKNASLNSFVETVIYSLDRKDVIKRWPFKTKIINLP